MSNSVAINNDPFAATVLRLKGAVYRPPILDGMNVIVTGHASHGKDVVCEIISKLTGCQYESSSRVAAREFIFDLMADKYDYEDIEECYHDRDNHRKEWFDHIVDYNTPDLTNLGRTIFNTSNIYCGLRNVNELNAMREAGLVDLVIWVDASERKPPEPSTSLTITREDCDWVIDNNMLGNPGHLLGEINRTLDMITALNVAA